MSELTGMASLKASLDAAEIVGGRTLENLAEPATLWNEGDAADGVILVLGGNCRFSTMTPFGEFEALRIASPCILGLSEIAAGTRRQTSLTTEGSANLVRIPEAEARALLVETSPIATAFRRLNLLSVARSIRSINRAIQNFFDDVATRDEEMRKGGSGPFYAIRPSQPADIERVKELLAQVGLDVPQLQQLGLTERSYTPGEKLAHAGEKASEAFLVQSGRVRVSVNIPGVGEEALSILGKGETIGEMALLDDAPRSADLVAHEDPVTVFVVSREVFRRLLDANMQGAERLVATILLGLSRRLDEGIARAISFFMMSGGSGMGVQQMQGFPDDLPDDFVDFQELDEPLDS